MNDRTDTAGGHSDGKFSAYRSTDESQDWLERNWERLKELFANVQLRDFVFEPIKGVFAAVGEDDASVIRQTITMVAVANAVMAGLPGKMGVGVARTYGPEPLHTTRIRTTIIGGRFYMRMRTIQAPTSSS